MFNLRFNHEKYSRMKKRNILTLSFLCCFLGVLAQQQSPNIVWIVCEDISPYLNSYGDTHVRTPNLDALRADAIQYNKAYTAAGVCAPSRSAIITGMHPISVGTQHMRTLNYNTQFIPEGVPARYSAVLPKEVKAFPEYLRMRGYYTTNNSKEDYQFEEPVSVWDESSPAASHRNRADSQAFFSIYNLARTHESQLMRDQDSLGYDPEKITLPLFYEPSMTLKKDMALLYTRIEEMDQHVGQIIEMLKTDGLYESSYIFFFSDHGGVLPWTKREIIERGTHIPLLVKLPYKAQRGSTNNDLISSVDFAPTLLSIAGIQPPDHLQGKAFLGQHSAEEKNKYVYAAKDRLDDKYDRSRSISDGNFRYVYNYNPKQPKYQDITYRHGIRSMKEILAKRDSGQINNPFLLDWFLPEKPEEELYYTSKDPDEVYNIANDKNYEEKKDELKTALFCWLTEVGDLSDQSEIDMIKSWWGNTTSAPKTAKVTVINKKNRLYLKTETEGASISYRIQQTAILDSVYRPIHSWGFSTVNNRVKTGDPIKVPLPWKVYQGEPLLLKKGEMLHLNAHRIGYDPAFSMYKN